MKFITRMRALAADDAGQDLLEYALLVGLIALVAIVAVTATGTSVKNVFDDVATRIKVPAAQ
jgi:pilus assembly protein Flp/PilA